MIESASKASNTGSSKRYNIRALELVAGKVKISRDYRLTVHFLDDSKKEFRVERAAKGCALLDLVFQHLDLIERDYFGLQYHDEFYTRRPECMTERPILVT